MGEELMDKLNEYYGSTYRPVGELMLRKEKLFEYTGGETGLEVKWLGLHIANTDLSLTVEGAQKLGTTSTRNTMTISKDDADRYYRGDDLKGYEGEGHVILKSEDRIIGPGRLEGGVIGNTLPESRRTRGG